MAKTHPNGEPKGESVLLRSLVTAAYIAITAVSVWFLKGGSLYGGRSAAHVWWYGWVTALSTGLGALPTAFLRTTGGDEDKYWLGLANAMAGGRMTSASAALIIEGVELGVGERAPFTPLQCVALGGVIGIMFIVASQRILDGSDDVKFSIIEGIDARRALLIVVVMTLHSFSEGIGIGVSFGEQTKESLGMLVTTTLAVHNVPEGFAVSVVLVSKGMSVWGAALWSVMTSIPQVRAVRGERPLSVSDCLPGARWQAF